MKRGWSLSFITCLILILADTHPTRGLVTNDSGSLAPNESSTGVAPSWYFAVSGDSRDCGDLIMPKIARAIKDNTQAPAEFYWHLGDFRRIFDIDCDMLKREYPSFDCKTRPPGVLPARAMSDYLTDAWDDFIRHQADPFDPTPVFLGIGNHELLAGLTRADYRKKFRKWLASEALHEQRNADAAKHLFTIEGDTYYHFIKNGVDFIYLDNADRSSFDSAQINWLSQILAIDAGNPAVRTIIVGMHAALPFSASRGHAMDATCQGICSGKQVYDLLYGAQNLAGPIENRKHVYVLASHSHYFEENIYDTPEHRGQVLPGWIVGTAGAEQYREKIMYGYLQVEVREDGTINPQFKEVTEQSLPTATGTGAQELTRFCFDQNKRVPGSDAFKGPCACGSAN